MGGGGLCIPHHHHRPAKVAVSQSTRIHVLLGTRGGAGAVVLLVVKAAFAGDWHSVVPQVVFERPALEVSSCSAGVANPRLRLAVAVLPGAAAPAFGSCHEAIVRVPMWVACPLRSFGAVKAWCCTARCSRGRGSCGCSLGTVVLRSCLLVRRPTQPQRVRALPPLPPRRSADLRRTCHFGGRW